MDMPHGTGIFLLPRTITLLHGGLIVQEVPLEDCGNVPQIAQARAGSPIVTGSDYWLATVAPSIVGRYVHYTLYQAPLTPLLCAPCDAIRVDPELNYITELQTPN